MKIHTIKNRWFLPVLSYAALAMTSHSQAAVIVTFAQVGDDVVATWSGSIDAGDWLTDNNFDPSVSEASSTSFTAVYGPNDIYGQGKTNSTGLTGSIDGFTGSGGFVDGAFSVAGVVDGMAPASSIHNFDTLGVTQTFHNVSLAGIGAASFNNTLAWTSSALGTNTISYTTVVPEPSSTALIISLGALALAVRRRR